MAGFAVHTDGSATENPELGAAPAIRKSCHFCRSRKIRCSGQRICAACRARNLDCVYGREASKGRPRGSTSASVTRKNTPPKDSKPPNVQLPEDTKPITDLSMPNYSDPVECDEQTFTITNGLSPKSHANNITNNDLIATHLENTFHRVFLEHVPQDMMANSNILPKEFNRPIWEGVNGEHKPVVNSPNDSEPSPITTVSYKRLFFNLIPGLVELVSSRFGCLGFCHRDDTLTEYFASSLAQDRTVTMFDTHSRGGTPTQYNDHQVCQMIELWFFHHPLSFIVSKTLLLHSYRSGTHDESLLAVILAGANYAFNEVGTKSGDQLFLWAQSRLCHGKAGSLSLPSIQSLILLGWHELCLSRARRGYCYLEMARIAIIDFHTRLSKAPRTDIDWINGVDVGKVELELSQRMYWLTFALELWAALQKDVPFLDPLPAGVEVKFPPLDQASSAVFTLDKESGNIATLGAQEKALSELWPLSHIASTIESIYALYPRRTDTASAFPASGWVSQTLPRLRHLLESPNNLSDVCRRIRDILSEGLANFEAQMGIHPSEYFILSVYRTLIIHLLFPRPKSGEMPTHMTETTMNDTIRFVTSFKDVLRNLKQPAAAPNILIDPSDAINPHMLVLGLDTCSRALYQVFTLSKSGSASDEDRMVQRQVELANLARDLHDISKHPRLRAVSTLSMVKKSLKCVKVCFERHTSRSILQSAMADPWLGTFQSGTISAGGLGIVADPQLLPVTGSGGFDLSPDFDFNSTMPHWNEDEWESVQSMVPSRTASSVNIST